MRPANILVWGAAAALAAALISHTTSGRLRPSTRAMAQLPNLSTVGAITAGHCASFASPTQLQDAGGGCATTADQVTFGAPGNPAATTSLTGVMMGLGTTCKITTSFSTRAILFVSGYISNNSANDGFLTSIYYGTGAAPANAAAPTGTNTNSSVSGVDNANGAALLFPFTVMGVGTSLTPGTAYWFDLNLKALTGGTASVGTLSCWAVEI